MSAIASALLAAVAMEDGDAAGARAHLSGAQRAARASARRDRQIVEIAALVVTGDRGRAAGLAVEHAAEFPEDAAVLARIAGPTAGVEGVVGVVGVGDVVGVEDERSAPALRASSGGVPTAGS
jgi:hypothetical protein